MDPLRWLSHPPLRRPVMILAFEGWNDAGEAASLALAYLARAFDAQPLARIDGEEFFDFTETRPQVRRNDAGERTLEWPEIELHWCPMPRVAHDLVFVRGVEPQLRWRTLAGVLAGAAQHLGVELAVTLGALLADVPHSRPPRVTGSSDDPDLAARLNLAPSRYEGPTGIVGVLHDALRRAGIPAASFWAAVPHYVHQVPSPQAALALVERAAALIGQPVDVVELQIAAAEWERQVSEKVAEDEDAAAYVASLEQGGDDDWPDPAEGLLGEGSLDQLAAEVERFLRDHPRGG
jgi:proteasome assembly chaperone (PAC2) family protein